MFSLQIPICLQTLWKLSLPNGILFHLECRGWQISLSTLITPLAVLLFRWATSAYFENIVSNKLQTGYKLQTANWNMPMPSFAYGLVGISCGIIGSFSFAFLNVAHIEHFVHCVLNFLIDIWPVHRVFCSGSHVAWLTPPLKSSLDMRIRSIFFIDFVSDFPISIQWCPVSALWLSILHVFRDFLQLLITLCHLSETIESLSWNWKVSFTSWILNCCIPGDDSLSRYARERASHTYICDLFL